MREIHKKVTDLKKIQEFFHLFTKEKEVSTALYIYPCRDLLFYNNFKNVCLQQNQVSPSGKCIKLCPEEEFNEDKLYYNKCICGYDIVYSPVFINSRPVACLVFADFIIDSTPSKKIKTSKNNPDSNSLNGVPVVKMGDFEFYVKYCSSLTSILLETLQAKENLENTIKERTSELENSLKKLESLNLEYHIANQHKDRFFTAISHELRTPLNSIMGFTDLLKKQFFGPLNEKQMEYVELIKKSSEHQLKIVTNILDLIDIDAGLMEMKIEPFNVRELLYEIESLIETEFKLQKIKLTCHVAGQAGDFSGDRKKVKQILMYLLANSLKYTPEGGKVEVTAKKASNSLYFSVKDTGVGIPEDEIENIFKDFYQAEYSKYQAIGGTGLGLSLFKKLVELQGGKFGVESKIGSGSLFWFTVPSR